MAIHALAEDLASAIESFTGSRIVHVRSVNRGYTPAQRLVISFADGSALFAKVGTNRYTSEELRKERRIYESLSGTFLPRYLGWIEGESPALLLEDLSGAQWPPPWTDHQIQQVLETLPLLWSSSVPGAPMLSQLKDKHNGWIQIADDPKPFLSLGIASEKWLKRALPVLLDINGEETVAGDSLLHLDIRSDNICIAGDRIVLIDWNLVCMGNPDYDLGFWLPSLQAEGGPAPESILPDHPQIAALVSGFFAARAGLPTIPDAPHVRHIQRVQLQTALPWAMRALSLPSLDG
ncbi:MAG: aminoglycoside phosphotransferase family protein [Caldilineaceae bacterium]|nr:aminoglycoside phosphotransferase family protein [Caldilineaceae bacterium]